MTEEYELAAFDRHSLNYDNIALGRLPTSVTSDPAVIALRELAYLPKGAIDPHGVPDTSPRAGQLPEDLLASWTSTEAGAPAPATNSAAKEQG
jgi:NAD(P)H-quinone oxidoreductase subunit I